MNESSLEKQLEDSKPEFLLGLAKKSIQSISLMQDLKRKFERNSEDELLISEIIHDEFQIIKTLMKEAESAKRTQKAA